MLKKVKIFMEKHHMIEQGDSIVAGVSGGADSVCLLFMLAELRSAMGFKLEAIHVEHGIRGEESLADAAFTEELCRRLEIPFRKYAVNAGAHAKETGKSLEEAARELRYDCFRQVCGEKPGGKIAVAHHGDDSAETMLFHLARGTGIRGLGGIAPVTQLEGPEVIRPLLCLTRREIEQWLEDRKQPYCVDSTNADINYARNRIRRQVMPELREVNRRAAEHMASTAAQLREISNYLDEAALQAGEGAYEVTEADGMCVRIRIFGESFKNMPSVLQKNLLHQFLERMAGSSRDITSGHVEQVQELFCGMTGSRIHLPYGIIAEQTYGVVELFKKEQETQSFSPAERILEVPGETFCENGMRIRTEIREFDGNFDKIPEKRYTKWFDYDKIKNTVWLRSRRSGDYIRMNQEGDRKKLRRYFIDEKIPAGDRDRIMLLAEEDHVLWVIGYRISAAYKVDGGTKRVLCVQCVNVNESM